MKEDKIQKLIDALFKKKYTKTYNHTTDKYESLVIDEQARNMVEDLIRNHISDDREERIGVLEAKVFAYEQIISKSTFAPLLGNPKPSSPEIDVEISPF